MSRLSRMQVGFGALVLAASVVALAPTAAWSQPAPAGDWTPPQTPWGDPDIGGVWNSSTVTPLQRPEALADKAFLTAEEAAAIEQRVVDANARANAPSVVRWSSTRRTGACPRSRPSTKRMSPRRSGSA